MDLGAFIVFFFFLFIVIFCAVRLAINPLTDKPTEPSVESDSSLLRLRDIEVLDTKELEEITEILSNKKHSAEKKAEYQKYAQVLLELKEQGYFTDDQYENKINLLKKHYKI